MSLNTDPGNSLKTALKKELDTLSEEYLGRIARYVKVFKMVEKFPDTDLKKIKTFVSKHSPTSKECIAMRKLFASHWDGIVEHRKISKALINYFETSCLYSDQHLIRHKNGDSRTGYYFEDKFFCLLKLFLDSRSECIDKGKQKFEVCLNEFISVKGYTFQQKPDILIKSKKTNAIDLILELKKSFSKSTLKHSYQKQMAKWGNFPKAKFLYVIFCTSASKIKTYKQNTHCRIVCSGLRTNQMLLNNLAEPKVHDSIENIFEEILSHLKSLKNRGK